MLYLVTPTLDQYGVPKHDVVDHNLLVWATDASEAIILWRDYYKLTNPDLGILYPIRVFEVPIMLEDTPSEAIDWGEIAVFSATTTQQSGPRLLRDIPAS
jgi:uncharacterized protein YbaR (Trm112 family)